MGFAGFGLGLNSMMQGLQNGLQLGKQIKDYRKESNIEDAKSQSLDEAKAAQEADKAAGHDGTPLMDYYMKVAAPRVREAYLQNGDVEGAAGWDKWINDDKVQKGAKFWANGVVAAQRGDHQGFLDNFIKSYNSHGYYDDGTTATGGEVLKDKDGNGIGFKITLKDKDGNERTQQFDSIADVYQSGLQVMAPENVFNFGTSEVKRMKDTAAQIAIEKSKFNREVALKSVDSNNQLKLADFKAGTDISRDNNKAKNDITILSHKKRIGFSSGNDPVARANSMAAALKNNAGWDDAKIKQAYPALLEVYRQSKSPQDQLSSTIELLSKNDMDFVDLSPQEKVAKAQELIDAQDELLGTQQQDNQQAAPQQTSGGSSGGIPSWRPSGTSYIRVK